MTPAQFSQINYILGRLEGIAAGCSGDLQTGVLDTCEMLAEWIDEAEKEARQ